MNKDRKEFENLSASMAAAELESQFILRLPEEPAKGLREILKSGENFKNRLTIQIDNDMRNGEVRFDDWLLHAKIVDLPTIVESLKTIDRKSVYKTADICQMMICKDELDPASTEDETPPKNKKKDPFKVDKKFLWPHGITPPTKNVRKRRFRKTLKKKSVEAPEIEKEVKRLLRADNEAVSFTWEVIEEAVKEDEQTTKVDPGNTLKSEKMKAKKESTKIEKIKESSSKVEDIFGGTLSDSDLEDENVNVEVEDSRLSTFDDSFSQASVQMHDSNRKAFATEFNPDMFYYSQESGINEPSVNLQSKKSKHKQEMPSTSTSDNYSTGEYTQSTETDNKLQLIITDLEELKLRKQRTQHEIAGMENMTLRQRFQDILHNINQDIMYKEMEYQRVLALK